MEYAQLLAYVFGEYPATEKDIINHDSLTLQEHVHELNQWLKEKLDLYKPTEVDLKSLGRIGPVTTVFDVDRDMNFLNISNDRLTIQSQSSFSSVRANTCVFKGKWMYEIQLKSKGVMQIGWCSSQCRFSPDTGVGDTIDSYGFDGSKKRIWNVGTREYGSFWRSGDMFGVCLNLDEGTIEYYRNGAPLGIAFAGIKTGPGRVLFPAVSLATNDSITANFGGSPFRYPVEGYLPLQVVPDHLLEKADFLIGHLANLARIISLPIQEPEIYSPMDNSVISKMAVYMTIAGILVNELVPLLSNTYVVEDKMYPYIKSLSVLRSGANETITPGTPGSTLGSFLTFLWTYIELEDMREFLRKLIGYLSSLYKETPSDLDYDTQRIVITVLTSLCSHVNTRKFYLEFEFFKKNCLSTFVYIKPPDESTLTVIIPDEMIWTEGIGGSKEKYLRCCDKLKRSAEALYALQKHLMLIILNNEDGDDVTASSRKIFLSKLRRYVMENSLEHRAFFFLQGNYTLPTQPAVALSFLCILVDCGKTLFAEEHPDKSPYVQPLLFYDGSLKYYHFDRVGGVISYLRKNFRSQMIARLGEDHNAITQPEPPNFMRSDLSDIYSAMFLISGNSNTTFSLMAHSSRQSTPRYVPIASGNVEAYEAICELLDSCTIYYYSISHKYVVLVADLRDNITMLNEAIAENKDQQTTILKNMQHQKYSPAAIQETKDRFNKRKDVFQKRSIELARKQAWYRAVALSPNRVALINWLLDGILNTLKDASSEGDFFSFVPEVYINVLPLLLDTVLDFSFHDFKRQQNISSSNQVVLLAADFLGAHSADNRVILASCKDALLQAIGTLICHEGGIRALEKTTSESQLALVKAILRPYENRAWGQSNWLLLRFWLGEGYGYRESRPPCIWQGGNDTKYFGLDRSRGKNGSHTGLLHHIAPPTPSAHFQSLISRMLIDDEPFCTALLNSILSQLNWAFSEFILLLQEIQNAAQRQDSQIVIEPRQLKICSMCFELTVSLMRSLEMIVAIAPDIFEDQRRQNSDLILARICQLVSQVLSRVTVPPGCFQFVVDLCLPDLTLVTHYAIVSAAIGIIWFLLKNEIRSDSPMKVPRITKALLTDPSFQIASLEFALGEVKTPILVPQTVPRGNFDPQMRAHIDPMTNEARVVSTKEIRSDPPIIQFSLKDYPSHISQYEIEKLRTLITTLLSRQSALSDIQLPSEDSLCPICFAKAISCTFEPCKHQSCSNCITQHLMSNKACFYCKTVITKVINFDDEVIYENTTIPPDSPPIILTDPDMM